MRKAAYLLFLSFTIMTLMSCQKEQSFEIAGDNPVALTGSLKMKINGVQWVSNRSASASIIAGIINISGMSSDGKFFTITLGDTTAKTYVLNQNSAAVAALSDSLDLAGISYASNQSSDTNQAGGTVTITNIDKVNKTISATFRVKLYRAIDGKQKIITEGVCDKLSYTSTLPPANARDTFYVKIDSTNWIGKSITSFNIGGSIIINATELDVSKSIGLTMPSNTTAGTYEMELFGDYYGQYNPDFTTYLSSDSGQVTIIEHNTTTRRIRGNFNFKGTEILGPISSLLTQGYFSVVYL